MIIETEGIVLRQFKISYGRRMVRLFTRSHGKISAGAAMAEKSRSRTALAVRPFTYGRYDIFKGRESYNINSAEVIRSFYGIGEDVEKYMQGAYVLEFTDKALPEGLVSPALFDLLVDFLDHLQSRKKGIGTLVLAYQIKLLRIGGSMPQIRQCACCGKEKKVHSFSIREGGTVCEECAAKLQNSGDDTLIYCGKFDIVKVLDYLAATPLEKLENIALNEEMGTLLQRIVRDYAAYHLDITDIKSEELV